MASTTALATPEMVEKRLEGDVTDDVRSMIEEYLEDASDQARYYGTNWTQANCPEPVKRLVALAVARFIRNPDGFTDSKAADESLGWQQLPDEYVGTVYFTPTEVERLQKMGNPRLPKFGSVQMAAHGTQLIPQDVHWPVSYANGKPFPLFTPGFLR